METNDRYLPCIKLFLIIVTFVQAQIHLIGNIVTWYAGSCGVAAFGALLALRALRARRLAAPPAGRAAARFSTAAHVLFLGYWLHYLPYFFLDRTLFLHHYLPAYVFKILLLAFVIEHVYFSLQLWERARPFTNVFVLCVIVWLAYVMVTFKKFSVLNYGSSDLTETELMSLRWKDTWDFILHKK